jgi:gliding motility-associated lipoprotein GldB
MSYTVKYFQKYIFFLCLVTLLSCKHDKRPDVSNINLNIKILRFDKDLFSGQSKPLPEIDTQLKQKYGNFYSDYVNRVVGNGSYSSTEILQVLYKDQAYKDLSHDADSVFKNITPIERNLTDAFKHILYYYPNTRVPKFISFVSGFEVQTPVGDDYVGIGMDMFLGKDSRFYGAIVQNVPRYLSRRFSPEYVVPRLTENFAREDLFPERDEERSLLAKMIQNGKILYFMDQVLPEEVPDSVKIGYTDKQLGWCKAYEGNIWAYFMESDLLFNTDYQKIQVYLTEGPYTPGLGEKKESAPKLGVWMGWQIVRKYMEENPKVSLQELMAERDAEKILHASGYKPKITKG